MEVAARTVAELEGAEFVAGKVRTQTQGVWAYVNWTPAAQLSAGAQKVGEFLTQAECSQLRYQLEPGEQPTLPPGS